MRGFQTQTKRKAHANGYADGGMVQSIKRAFGMDEERNARIAAYRARAAQEKAAAAAAAQPAAPASAPSDRAISDYSGMGATQRREKAAGLKDGGMVRGPGTGISDDVPDQVPEGTYIMPADSTAQLGPDKLASMGARGFKAGGKKAAGAKSVPVNLSNGEFKMPPEQVHAVGVQALEQMKNATHTPAAQQAGEPEMFFANGGAVFGSRGLEGLKAMIPKVAAMGFPQQQAAPVAPAAPAQGSRNVADLKAMIPQMEAMGFKQNPQYLADGGQVRREEGGGLSKEAVMAAIAKQAAQQQPAAQPAQQPAARGFSRPATDFLRNPGGILAQRERQAGGYADGGLVRRPGMNMDEWAQQQEQQRTTATREQEAMAAAAQAGAASQIPTDGYPRAPAPTGQADSELTRNVNNALNAMGGIGVVASVPLRAPAAAQELRGAYQTLTGPAAKAAAPAADFIAGAGPNATTMANTIPRLGNAPTPVLPGTNAALQQGAQANAMSGAVRAASGASAGATALDSTQRNNPAAAPATAPAAATQSEYGRQMSAVGGALVDGAAWLGKTIVSAPGYGFNKPSAAPAPAGAATANAGAGRGAINPASVNPAQPVAAATAPTNAATDTAAAPTQPPTNEVMPGVYRHGRGQYSDNATGMGFAPGFTGQPSAANNAILQRMSDQSQAESMARIGMSQYAAEVQRAKNINADEAARNNSVGARMQRLADPFSNEGRAMRNLQMNIDSSVDRKGRPTAKTEALVAQFKAMSDGYLAEPNQQRTIDAGLQREGMQQDGATMRTSMQEQGANTREAGRNALATEELGLKREAQGFQTRAAQQQEQLRNVLLDPKSTPEQRAVAQRSLAALSGKTAADRMQTVTLPDTTNEMGQVVRGGQALVRVLEDGTVQQVPIGGQQKAEPQGGLPKVTTPQDLAALKSGTRFVDSNGVERIKK